MDDRERIVLLDALRGFALCGVFLSNAYVWFSSLFFRPPEQLKAAAASASLLDAAANYAFAFFIHGSAFTLFAFCFGLGFFIQMDRAQARGASIVPLYARRLAVLFALGLAHLFLLWFGDILSTYAVVGFCLLLLRNRSDRALLIWACVLILGGPLVGMFADRLPLLMRPPEIATAMAQASAARLEEIRTDLLQSVTAGSYRDVYRAYFNFYFGAQLSPATVGVLLYILGRFLLGLWAGRHRIFHEASGHMPLFRHLLGWGLLAGVLGKGGWTAFRELALRHLLTPAAHPLLAMSMFPLRQMGEIGFAAVYVAAFALLFQRAAWRRLLSALAPAGRMALSNYLGQSAMGMLLYNHYGLGLAGKVGPATCLGLTLVLFAVQVASSHLWLARFRFGPAEWLWRSLTYGKAQPMRRAALPDVGPAMAA